MPNIDFYVFVEMSAKDKNEIWIGDHEILKSAYMEWAKEKDKELPSPLGKQIQNAWNAVCRSDMFEPTDRWIKSVLFSPREHWHRLYRLKRHLQ